MSKVYFSILILAAFVLTGCASTPKNTTPGFSTYTANLSGDGSMQIIDVQDNAEAGTGNGIDVTVYSKGRGKEKTKIDGIELSGKLSKVDLIELNNDGQKQLAIYTRKEGNITNLVVYCLQNNILTKMFDSSSEFGIKIDSMGVIARIKIGKPQSRPQPNSPNCLNEWQTWVWAGDKFVKE
ncbi:MAG: hypothetical protein NTZ92_06500 [Candidatus Omnitrophica bacterium]|nr:hypothetical protein [Candidatus Omnitrophota bacterium]